MTNPTNTLNVDKPRLYHAPSSYYSMIARLALAEGGIGYEPVFVDIHLHMSQQLPDYVRLNPNMTVPTLVLPGRILDQSRTIAEFALGAADDALDAETRRWLDLHYSYPIEELTFGGFLARHRLARFMIPKKLAASHRRLLAMAAANPDLAEAYEARAAVFAERARIFDPEKALRLAETRRAEAIGLMDRLESHLADGRAVMLPPTYGLADVVWTVFLARMEFVGMGAEIAKRPALARYWGAMQARTSFAAADIWTRLHVLRLVGGALGIVKP
jgi:ganglioside-induced differentiation-associated protein 1